MIQCPAVEKCFDGIYDISARIIILFDCQNFFILYHKLEIVFESSKIQCILAGCGVMNYRSTYGWYYRSLRDRAPSWTSVTYLYRFLTTNQGPGPYGRLAELSEAEPGDIVQLRFLGNEAFGHSPVITSVGEEPTLDSVLVAAHSMDCGSRPLSTYKNLAAVRVIHLEGARRWRA